MAERKKTILVVDDEIKITEVIKSYLENSGYEVLTVYNGKQALEVFEKSEPSLVILDLMLPDVSGEEICMSIRRHSRVPVIMLTAKIEETDVLKGLDIGADDYITKPFSPRQLVARVKAILRRTGNDSVLLTDVVSYNNGELIIDLRSNLIKKSGTQVNFTPNEAKLISALVSYPKKIFTREELISLVMGEDFEGYDRVIDTHIKNIRQKIETDAKNPKYILTVHGVGYRFGGEVQ